MNLGVDGVISWNDTGASYYVLTSGDSRICLKAGTLSFDAFTAGWKGGYKVTMECWDSKLNLISKYTSGFTLKNQ